MILQGKIPSTRLAFDLALRASPGLHKASLGDAGMTGLLPGIMAGKLPRNCRAIMFAIQAMDGLSTSNVPLISRSFLECLSVGR